MRRKAPTYLAAESGKIKRSANAAPGELVLTMVRSCDCMGAKRWPLAGQSGKELIACCSRGDFTNISFCNAAQFFAKGRLDRGIRR